MQVLNYAFVGFGAAGCGFAVTAASRGGRITGWFDIDPAVRSGIDGAGGLSHEGLGGQGALALPRCAADGSAAVAGADVVIVSTTADRHAEVAAEIAGGLAPGQVVILHCGYVGGTKVFADALDKAGAPKDLHLFELNNTLHLAGKLNSSTVVLKGQKRWLELAGRPEGTDNSAYRAFCGQFPEFTYSPNVLENGLNNPNCIGHVPAYIGGAVTLDRDMGDITSGILQFDEARMGRVNLMAAAFEHERDVVIAALGLAPLSSAEFSARAYPAGSRQFGGIARFGPKLQRRFVHEDIPCSLVPLEMLGKQAGAATPITTALIELANVLEGQDFRASGRNETVLGRDWIRSYTAA